MKEKILIAMSGGVDSSVAALLAKKEADVMGVTMRLLEGLTSLTAPSLADEEDARAVADKLNIPFRVLDMSAEFRREVVDRFVSAYQKGWTPNPCVECNRFIKFGALQQAGEAMGCGMVATGHYVRKGQDPDTGRYFVRRAADLSKDQSYMLYGLSQEELSKSIFPLGEMDKAAARSLAEENGLITSRKKDSQDICFVRDESYADFIERYTGLSFPEGDFVDESGKVLGRHKGVIRYTIGQRKGLGLALPASMYVLKLDMENNRVILGFDQDLFSDTMELCDINLMKVPKLESPVRAMVKARYAHRGAMATVEQIDDDRIRIVFDEPQRALTMGQAAVIYDGDDVLGGGTICRV